MQHLTNPETPAHGLSGNISHTNILYQYLTGLATAFSYLTVGFSNINVGWNPVANVATANVQWIPIGSATPVIVTPDEQTAIMSGIAARTNTLNVKKNAKVTAVNALTTIPAVIAYNVTTGW